jgi:MFS family permease
MNPNDRAITGFTMVGHAMFHTYELVIPIFVVIWLDVYSTTAAFLGLVVGGSYALTGIGALPSGILTDRYSSKRLILLYLLGMGAAFALVSVAPNLAVLTVALLVWGAVASVYHPAGLALISRGTKKRGTAFAFHGAAGNVGVVIGPLLTAVLLAFFHWRIVAATLVAPVVIALLIVTRLEFDETAGSEARGAALAGDGRGEIWNVREFVVNTKRLFTGGVVIVFLIGILLGTYYRGTLTFMPDVLADMRLFEPVERFGRTFEPSQYVYSGLLLLGGVGQYVGGKLVDRVPVEYALVGGYVLLILLALAFIPSANAGLGPLLVVAGLVGFAVFGLGPINQEAISKYSAVDVRGLSYGYTYAAIFGVGALGATLAGVILTYSTPSVLFVVLAGFAATAATLGAYLLYRSTVQTDG